LRHDRAVDWKTVLVQTHGTSPKLVQLALRAAVVTQSRMQGVIPVVLAEAAELVVDWALTTTAKAEIAKTSKVLKSMSFYKF